LRQWKEAQSLLNNLGVDVFVGVVDQVIGDLDLTTTKAAATATATTTATETGYQDRTTSSDQKNTLEKLDLKMPSENIAKLTSKLDMLKQEHQATVANMTNEHDKEIARLTDDLDWNSKVINALEM